MIYQLTTFKDLKECIDTTKPLFCDCETIGLYGTIRLFQCNQEHWEQVRIIEFPNVFELYLLLKTVKHEWHNAHYDLTTIQAGLANAATFDDYEDTFLASRLAQPQYDEYSLDAVMTRVLGYDPYTAAKLDKKKLQKSDWGVAKLSEDQYTYAAIDVKYMPEVHEAVKDSFNDSCYILDKSCLNLALDFQQNGMPVDEDRLNQAAIEANNKLDQIPMPINANSWQQVRAWLNVDQSDKIFLSKLAIKGNDKAQAVLDVRKYRKQLSFLAKYDVDYLIGKFKPSARSGRFTSDDENLQQIPRALKNVFGYPEGSDRVLIYSDYAQLELRTICAILGVKLMERLFRDDVDLHGYVASALFGEDYSKDDRQVTKTYNFNLLYGGSVGMVLSILITYGYWIEERQANRHKRKWLNLFPEIDRWQQEQISAWRKGKLGSTPFGRQYKGKLMTDQMNIKNQGAGAEVAKLALHYFLPWLKTYNEEHGTDVKLCNFIHDSYIVDAPNYHEVYEVVSRKLAECMQEAWFEMSKLYKIKDLPMPINVKVGHNWGDLEEDLNVIYEFDLKPQEMLK